MSADPRGVHDATSAQVDASLIRQGKALIVHSRMSGAVLALSECEHEEVHEERLAASDVARALVQLQRHLHQTHDPWFSALVCKFGMEFFLG
jgi:hypothetical protein